MGVGRCGDEISSQGDEGLALFRVHGLDCVHRIESMFSGRFEPVYFRKPVEKGVGHLFVDAHCPVTLHVAVTPDRAKSGSGLPRFPSMSWRFTIS